MRKICTILLLLAPMTLGPSYGYANTQAENPPTDIPQVNNSQINKPQAPLYPKGKAMPMTGELKTLPIGHYICSLPGDAEGQPWLELPQRSFKIGNASTYEALSGRGTYVMVDKILTFTRGPFSGLRMLRTGTVRLALLDNDGEISRVLCIRKANGKPG